MAGACATDVFLKDNDGGSLRWDLSLHREAENMQEWTVSPVIDNKVGGRKIVNDWKLASRVRESGKPNVFWAAGGIRKPLEV